MEDDRETANLGPEIANEIQKEESVTPKEPKKRFVGRKTAADRAAKNAAEGNIEDSGQAVQPQPRRAARTLNAVPASILEDADILAAIALLPPNYSFEIPKTIHRIRTTEARRIALQFPEGLLLFATTISDILRQFCPSVDDVLIMGDVTYGACCVDDYTARALGCDMLVHYAHSCLVPVSVTHGIKTLYVFVDISIDVPHLLATVRRNFQPGKTIALVGTIQFNATVHSVVPELRKDGYDIAIPQSAPLSRGEILGCTAPTLATRSSSVAKDIPTDPKERRKAPLVADILLYLGDGRFHLEAAMIANPSLPSYRYDPYSRRLTRESYDHDAMLQARRQAITTARGAKRWGLILGALGRQGNPHTLGVIEKKAAEQGVECMRVVLSEIFPGKLAMMSQDIGAWVQVACPRLSIDWGYAFERPLMSPYEALVALGVKEGNWLLNEERFEEEERREKQEVVYPMDYYAKEGLGRVSRHDVVVG